MEFSLVYIIPNVNLISEKSDTARVAQNDSDVDVYVPAAGVAALVKVVR